MKLRVGIAGFGFMGRMHARVYQALPDVEIAGIADTCPDVVTQARQFDPKIPVFPTLDQLIHTAELDAIDVCLPTDLHADAVVAAAQAGKHVFCEKPFALEIADAERALAAVESSGVILQVGQCIRFWPEYQALEQFMRSGRGGRLISLSLQRRASRPDYSRDHWLLDPARSKGAALDLHIHDTDYVLHLLGTPRSVRSIGRITPGDLSRIFTHYHFDEVVVAAEGAWDYPAQWGFQMAFQAVFERAVVEFDSRTPPSLHLTPDDGPRTPLPFDKPAIGASDSVGGNISDLGGYYNELVEFCRCVKEGRAPSTNTGRDAMESLRVALAEMESARAKKTVFLWPGG